MSQKKFGKFIALATVSGVIAAGISYFLKYKSFHDELEEDFHDFEGDDEFDGELPHAAETPVRTYVTLNEKKEDASDLLHAAADKTVSVADAIENRAASITDTIADKAASAADAVSDKAASAADAVSDDLSDLVKDAVKETAEAVKKASTTVTATIEDDVL